MTQPTPGRNPGTPSKATQARQTADKALEALAEQLDRGNSDTLNAFLEAMSRFHQYSFHNIMLILSQRPDASRVAGFKTWLSLGRHVKKGEKGITILAPMRVWARDGERGDRSKTESDGDLPTVLRFRAVHVFDVSQTDGEPLPEPARAAGNPGAFLDRLERHAENLGITVLTQSEDMSGADGLSLGGEIRLAATLSAPERFSVLAHELAHELLHKDKDERPPKTVRELEAEAVAHVVCDAVGLETEAAAADYIRLYNGNRELLAASLDRIQKTACSIIAAVTGGPRVRNAEDERTSSVDPQAAHARATGRGR